MFRPRILKIKNIIFGSSKRYNCPFHNFCQSMGIAFSFNFWAPAVRAHAYIVTSLKSDKEKSFPRTPTAVNPMMFRTEVYFRLVIFIKAINYCALKLVLHSAIHSFVYILLQLVKKELKQKKSFQLSSDWKTLLPV